MGKLRRHTRGTDIYQALYSGGGRRAWSLRAGVQNWESGGLHESAGDTVHTPGIAQRKSGTDRFFHEDWLGSTRFLTDAGGLNAPFARRYDAWGNETAALGGPETVLRFAGGHGYRRDAPGGLQLLGHRYYDPSLGRFISPDPIAHAGGLNLYAYCENDPVGAVDPSGLVGSGVQPNYRWVLIYRVPQPPARVALASGLGTLLAPTGLGGVSGIGLGSFAGSLLDGDSTGTALKNAAFDTSVGLVLHYSGGIACGVGGRVLARKPRPRPKPTSSPLPGSYVNARYSIDMSGAPASSQVNAAGFRRDGDWFWRKMLESYLELFSPDNVILIQRGRSPLVDDQWIKDNPTHQGFVGDKLIHHHIDQGGIATGIPQTIHQKWHAVLHPKR